MHSYIKKLQSKEEDARKRILTGSLIVSMLIVSSIWVYGITAKFTPNEVAVADDTSVKPFTLFKNSISGFYQDVTASVGKISFSKKEEQKQVGLTVVENPSAQ